ncbi:GntR family transcriptional regulator [Salsuginibacillus halophilus]|uniref:GntR family transcriptional regulator n=1 Tax=Salsuginibacillus halophilus TaxID=517424 RepID=A0A2P8HQH1_9BACI|nr:GntR family transcriptional regulator [Salsuginibacillus halophilus]PSL48470.1 GntR family transcriptional regulator [Salsuginibacillus halophilus]
MTNEKINKTKHAYDVIKSRILDGTYAAGQRIILDQIAKEVGSSVIPVREAIRRLEADKLIEYKPNTGPVVHSIDEKIYMQTLELLAVLEGYATALSASHMTEKDIGELKRLNEAMQTALSEYDFQTLSALNKQFHFLIYDLCPNQLLITDIKESWARLDTVRHTAFTLFPMRAPASIEEHAKLVSLLEAGASTQEIEEHTRKHKLNTLEAYKKTQLTD